MTDERERRFRARIDLRTGKHEVIETHPVDRRTAAMIPAQVRAPERAEPPHTVEPVTAPLFPWQRRAPTPTPTQETAQPTWQPPEVDPMQQVWSHDAQTETIAAPQDNTLGWVTDPPREQSASEVPWTGVDPLLEQQRANADAQWQAQSDGSELARQQEARFVDHVVELTSETVLSRLRPLLGLPLEEPPVAPPVVEDNATLQYHPAGAFASTPRPREYHPAGAFANRTRP